MKLYLIFRNWFSPPSTSTCAEKKYTQFSVNDIKKQHILPLPVFFLFSTGLKCTVGIGQTNCIGSASIKAAFFLSQPAPSRYNPRTHTPSYNHNEKFFMLHFTTQGQGILPSLTPPPC